MPPPEDRGMGHIYKRWLFDMPLPTEDRRMDHIYKRWLFDMPPPPRTVEWATSIKGGFLTCPPEDRGMDHIYKRWLFDMPPRGPWNGPHL